MLCHEFNHIYWYVWRQIIYYEFFRSRRGTEEKCWTMFGGLV